MLETSELSHALRWGGPQGADNWQAFYLGNETGTYTFTAPGQNGLSDYRFYNPREVRVPDAGSSILLLGLAMGSLSGIARSLKRA